MQVTLEFSREKDLALIKWLKEELASEKENLEATQGELANMTRLYNDAHSKNVEGNKTQADLQALISNLQNDLKKERKSVHQLEVTNIALQADLRKQNKTIDELQHK